MYYISQNDTQYSVSRTSKREKEMNHYYAMSGMAMIVLGLQKQAEAGRTKTDGNIVACGQNLWGWLGEISQEDHELSERVRRTFLLNPPAIAAELIEGIRRDHFRKMVEESGRRLARGERSPCK